jgi:tellurite resistance protein TerC
MIKSTIDFAYRNARRIVIGIVGGTVLLIGVVLLVLPGPAFIVIPIGLAILSVEFAWARSWLLKVRRSISARSLSPMAESDLPDKSSRRERQAGR